VGVSEQTGFKEEGAEADVMASLAAACSPLTAPRGQLRENEPMSGHVSWRAGGVAAKAYFPADLADLCLFLKRLRTDEPLLMVGLGSNLLVRDGGYAGTVIFTHGALSEIRLEPDPSPLTPHPLRVYVEAGVGSPKLARFAAGLDLVGAEFLAGVPGTLGGALAMNAGCHGGETWQIVERVLMVNRVGELTERRPDEFSLGYRHVGLKAHCDEWFVAAWLKLESGSGEAAKARMKEMLDRRSATQPLSLPNAGSVFRNPPGDHAARLIQEAGLKGLVLGGAQVSEKHANFIVNPEGKARAADIEALIERVQAEVLAKFGVQLVREVRIVGEAVSGKR
jgi:UDP-N-acetylmuramate dehydrogenase